MTTTAVAQKEIKLEQWRYREASQEQWQPCHIPSLIQELLIKEQKLPDPHYRSNENLVQGIEERDWLYEATFTLPEMQTARAGERYILNLEGIDTYSDIYINGQKVAETDNMFVGYELNISPYIQRGANSLRIHLKSPMRIARPLQERAGFNYPADNDHAPIKLSPFTRKAPYHYGWDWGMRMITMGIWQPITLRHYKANEARLTELRCESHISWQGLEASTATLQLHYQIEQAPKKLTIELRSPSGELIHQASIKGEEPNYSFTIKQPELWWPREWGKPKLYTLSLKDDKGRILSERAIGIRDIKLRHGESQTSPFYFEVNKRPLFARGANYVPSDNLLTRRKDEDFRRLFDDLEYAHMNMLRVWGGGVYEDERLYREADRRGILIWQDFMFACTAYPADSSFLESVEREARYQIARLRQHPSVALWCGNNEVEEAIKYWGWQKRYTPGQYAQMQADYKPLFRELLPRLVSELSPETAYIHSSPTSANWGRPSTWLEGDSHYWGLWYGEEPFTTFDDKTFAFVSEFGFQSFPDVPSLRQFALPEDMSLESEVMRQHQKASTGNSLIRKYMERDYNVPERFEDFVYVGQVMQARGMEHAVRALRRHRPTTMGALVWQLNDSWPAVSWSSIDYYGNYKALHYRLRDAFAPTTLLAHTEGKQLNIYATNDGLQALQQATLKLELRTFAGEVLERLHVSRETLTANQNTQLLSTQLSQQAERADSYYQLELSIGGKVVSRLKHYLHPAKTLELPRASYRSTLRELAHQGDSKYRYQLKITARSFVKDLWLYSDVMGLRYSDNLLDLAPGEEASITIVSPQALSSKSIQLKSLAELHPRKTRTKPQKAKP